MLLHLRELVHKAASVIPADFNTALNANESARLNFAEFAPGYQRDYIDWISGAKTDKTRQNRLDIAVEWIAEGKHRNWKYEGEC